MVIATTGHRAQLLRRALASIDAQSHAAQRILVAVDVPRQEFERVYRELRSTYRGLTILCNRRTCGASGAWNTAIDHLLRTEAVPREILVSFLDDDDYWHGRYLEEVAAVAGGGGAEVIGATLIRHDEKAPDGRASLTNQLVASEFLVGNPGLQPTNLSIRLDTLAAAGCFDEALPSCTDRDLCVRLADLGARYYVAPTAVAHHDTLHGLARLSDPGSSEKHAGLTVFYAKYRDRMTREERAAFTERAGRLFRWTPPGDDRPAPLVARADSTSRTPYPIRLVVGIIVDSAKPARTLPLVDQLAGFACSDAIDALDLVLLQNDNNSGFGEIARYAVAAGLGTWVVDRASQRALATELGLAERGASSATIATARTLLQRAVHVVARRSPGAVAWILDDDVRLTCGPGHLAAVVAEARARGVAVGIGDIIGAPPVPSASTLRIQLVDIFHFLANAARKQPNDPPPDARVNDRWRAGRRDYYYDLARSETDRLETPFAPESTSTLLADAVRELAAKASRILAGELVTRAIRVDDGEAWMPTHLRGGNTLVLDLDLLGDIPNLSPELRGRRVRRSDMIWALEADRAFGKLVVRAPIAVAQDRAMESATMEDARKLVEDIVGYGFFRAYEDSAGEPETLRRRARKLALERVAAYRLSFFRARGLVRAIRNLIDAAPWWSRDPRVLEDLNAFLDGCDEALTEARLDAIVNGVVTGINDLDIDGFFADRARLHRPAGEPQSLSRWHRTSREGRARELLATIGIDVESVLGMGSEGVVMRTQDRVFKVFDAWSKHEIATNVGTLRQIAATHCEAFPRVRAVHHVQGVIVLESVYENSEPYRGGHGPALLAALRALRAAGWTHTNVHPKNVRLTESGAVRIIDVGRSIVARTDVDEELMIRRAFLSWRFWFRSDLDQLMRGSLASDDLVEIVGWRALLEGVREAPAKERLDRQLEELVEANRAGRLLDFGAGKPRQIHREHVERSWIAFDVDQTLRVRWAAEASAVDFLDEPALASMLERGETVDAVLCSLLLCAVDDATVDSVLGRVRRLINDTGCAWVAVCDPTSVHVGVTADFERRSGCVDYHANGTYLKHVRDSETTRTEHHRSLWDYRHAFARAGFVVEREATVDGIDAQRFERVSEFRIFEVRPLAPLPCRTSLLIKVCGMDAATLSPSVRHLVRQLGRPRAFSEIVVVVDPRDRGFARPHHDADLARIREELAQLRAARVVDRLVEGPCDGEHARVLAREWFGCETSHAHVANGQPALAILAGIEACSGDVVFHADVDVMIARPDDRVDLHAEAHAVFASDATAVALSLPAFGTIGDAARDRDARGPFRVDAVCGWVHRSRLLTLRPLPNAVDEGVLERPWHRALDVAVQAVRARSLRKGSRGAWFAHPDNARKMDPDEQLLLVDRIEANQAPGEHAGHADVTGSLASWCRPVRAERVVVAVMGREVSPGRARRCLDSLRTQTLPDWGAVVIDDASTNGCDDALVDACTGLGDRITLVKRRRRVGLLANLVLAVRHFVSRPDAIVVTLDLDDALAPDALARIVREHDLGADVTVGSMIRTDKESRYEVDFADPRHDRGGNVWQHARSFRKRLFDQIELEDLQVDGRYIDLATDWAFMLPIVELAKKPVWIKEPLYLHEPSEPRDEARVRRREQNIAVITRRPSYRERVCTPSVTVLAYHRILDDLDGVAAIYRGIGMGVSPRNFEAHLRAAARRFEPVRLGDVEAAFRGERALPPRALLVTLDDGYVDAERAISIALKLGFPVGMFCRAPMRDGRPTWAPLDLLYHARACRRLGPPGSMEREQMLAWPLADQLEHARAGVDPDLAVRWRDALYLHETRLRELTGPDVALGAHGADHVRWTKLDDESLRQQIETSFDWLVTFSSAARAVAYPDGCADARVAQVAAAAGASLGFTIGGQRIDAPLEFAIERLVPSDDPAWLDMTEVMS